MKFCAVNGNIAGTGANFLSGNVGNGGNGGGVYSTNYLSMINCTVSGNTAGAGAQAGQVNVSSGGGVIILGGSGGITASSLTTNSGGNGGNGGGIYTAGSFSLKSCTIVSNSAGQGGPSGDVFEFGGPPTNGSGSFGGRGGSGGGVYDASDNSSANVENTLIALNSEGGGGVAASNSIGGIILIGTYPGTPGVPGADPDVFGPFFSQGFNLIGAGDGSTGFTGGVMADQVGTTNAPINPVIGPLQMNGGPTATHALLPGSPAINKGFCFGVHQDQRGEYRPFDYPGAPYAMRGDGSDIGAFELHDREQFEPRREGFGER